MPEMCEYMLAWFMEQYANEEHPMSPEVYDRAVFVVGVGVPMLLFAVVLFAFCLAMVAAFDNARGHRR